MRGGGGPIADGGGGPRAPWEIFLTGEHNQVPVIVGAMANERKSLGANTPERPRDILEGRIRNTWGEQTSAVLDAYHELIEESTKSAEQRIGTDSGYVWQACLLYTSPSPRAS